VGCLLITATILTAKRETRWRGIERRTTEVGRERERRGMDDGSGGQWIAETEREMGAGTGGGK
jgi:hypothetical protein